mmetsp:Transcript_115978/g.289667  ORF Transcript_115978/g.289667 Transcript_115978/m.289667 type:complete len:81 (+) Transcript_115978:69-311(+)
MRSLEVPKCMRRRRPLDWSLPQMSAGLRKDPSVIRIDVASSAASTLAESVAKMDSGASGAICAFGVVHPTSLPRLVGRTC